MELSLGEQLSLRRSGVINVKGSAGRSTFYLPPGWWTSVCLKGGFLFPSSTEPLQPPDSIHLEAAQGRLEQDNHEEANKEPELIDTPARSPGRAGGALTYLRKG